MEHPRAGVDYPGNWHELLAWFPDDAACLRYLERLRWGERFVCRFCGGIDGGWWQMGDGLRRCKACLEELRARVRQFARDYNQHWLLERHNYRTPAEAREHLLALAAAMA